MLLSLCPGPLTLLLPKAVALSGLMALAQLERPSGLYAIYSAFILVCACLCICMCACVYICVCLNVYACVCICVYVCMCVCVYVCMWICLHMYGVCSCGYAYVHKRFTYVIHVDAKGSC